MNPSDFSLDLDVDLNTVVTRETEKPGKPVRILLKKAQDTVDEYIIEVDNSALEKFTVCSRASEYYLVHHREIATPRPALKFGSAIHKALEVQGAFGNGPQSADRQNEVILAHFESEGPNPPDDFRTPERAIQLMEKYRKKYPSEAWELMTNENGDPMVEIKFSVPLGYLNLHCDVHYPFGSTTFITKLHIIWTGKIDELVEMDGHPWVLDHKTSSMGGKLLLKDFELNNAQHGYVWAAQQLLGRQVRGSILNVMINRPPTPTGKSFEFLRQMFPYSPDQIDEWQENTMALVADFIYHLRRGYFPRETKWCTNKYGVCEYHDVCTLDRHLRLGQLRSEQYKNVVWNPLDNE